MRNISNIVPDSADIIRANELNLPDNSRIASNASKMSKLIKVGSTKLVRRSKAVALTWRGTRYFDDAWGPFEQALKKEGYTNNEIEEIKNYSGSNTHIEPRKQVNAVSQDDEELKSMGDTLNKRGR